MTDLVRIVLPGLGAGGLYALVGLGIVVVYRGSGLINFASGGFALLGAIAYVEFTSEGRFPAWVGVMAAIAVGAIAGAATHLVILRPMRTASPLARVTATLAVLTLILESARLHYGERSRFVESFLPGNPITVLGAKVPADRLILLALTAGLTLMLWLIYQRTSIGRVTTGVAENEQAIAALGWSPSTVSAINWAAGGAVCALAGVLLTAVVGNALSPTTLTLAVVPALAAALIGGFASFPLTLAGGLLVGVLQALSLRYIDGPGWPSAVPFLVVIAILVIRGQSIPLRGHRADRLPRIGSGHIRLVHVLIAMVCAGALLSLGGDWSRAVTTSTIFGVLCLSLVVVVGYAGQLSLAQLALAGIAALATARLSALWDWPLPVVLVVAVAVTIAAGLLVALPAVRVRGANLAVVTLSLALVISAVVLTNPSWTKGSENVGVRPDLVLRAPSLFGLDISETAHPERYAAFAMLLLLLGALMVANLRRGRSGRRLIAVRANERAAASVGVGVVATKLYAFGVGAGLAALAGVLIAYRNPTVQFDQFNVISSINVVLLAVIGGIGAIVGAVIGGVNANGGTAQEALSTVVDLKGWFALIAPLGLIGVLIFQPDGLAFPPKLIRRRRRGTARVGIDNSPAPSTQVAHSPEVVRRSAIAPAAPSASPQRVAPLQLTVTGLSVRFGIVTAVADVSLTVEPGQIVGLIGPNGAGKTSFVDAISGLQRASGSIRLGERDLGSLGPTSRARAGLARSFQSLELFDDLTVRDNLRVAAEQRTPGGYASDLVWPRTLPPTDTELAAIQEFGLTDVLDSFPADLPYAQRRLVAIARSVAAAPSVLMLDEPAAGLDERSTSELADLIRRLSRDWGMGVLLIEHDVPLVFGLCDRVLVLNFGSVIADGPPEEVAGDPAVLAAYLGGPTSSEPDEGRGSATVAGHQEGAIEVGSNVVNLPVEGL